MGNVLIGFKPDEIVGRLGLSEEDSALLKKEIFHTQEWACLDDGSMLEAEAYDSAIKRLPEHLHGAAHQLIYAWDQPLDIIHGTEELVCELKERGFRIYLLSNASSRQKEYWVRIPASKYFDGTLISADIRIVKPDPAIYRELFKRFGLRPDECLFIDDSQANIKGAAAVGMKGFLFKGDVEELREWLEKVSIL